MIRWEKITGFEWDAGNVDKSYKKHGITPNEAEEIFLDEKLLVAKDIKHADAREDRFIALGKTGTQKTLLVVFTFRGHKIRVISARQANRKERKVYEEKTQKNPSS